MHKVKAGEAKSVYFPIVPAELGQISLTVKAQSVMAADAVKRQLLVEVMFSLNLFVKAEYTY